MDAKMRGDFRARMQGIEGANLKRLRLERRWTQEELAEKLGTHAKYLSPIENGKRGIGNGLMSRLCQVFGVSEAEFRVGAGDEVMSVGGLFAFKDRENAFSAIGSKQTSDFISFRLNGRAEGPDTIFNPVAFQYG